MNENKLGGVGVLDFRRSGVYGICVLFDIIWGWANDNQFLFKD